MLQIISGKFFESDDRHVNNCKGVFYSNSSFYKEINTCIASLDIVNVYGQVSCFTMNYINQIEREKESQGFELVRIGDYEIQKQFQYICTFGLEAIFDQDKTIIQKVCRSEKANSYEHDIPSRYINRYFDLDVYLNENDISVFINLVSNIIGLPREVYKVVMNCFGAFHAALMLLDEDMNLAYSMMVYCLETLSQDFDNYVPKWSDYPERQRNKLEKSFSGMSCETVDKIKDILITNEHLKLTKRFINFAVSNLDDAFFIDDAINIKRAVTKDEIEQALSNAYNIRSKFVHKLEPIMKQLTHSDIVKNSDVFIFENDSFLTFSGLARVAHKVISSFITNYPKISQEKYDWRNDLPGMTEFELAPQYWIWKTTDFSPKQSKIILQGFFHLIVSGKEGFPDMRPLLVIIQKDFHTFTFSQKTELYCLFRLYNGLIRKEYRSNGYEEFIGENEYLLSQCTIVTLAMLTLPVQYKVDISWQEAACEKVIKSYNKNKFNRTHIRLPNSIEALIYLKMADSYEIEDCQKRQYWLNRALVNCSGQKAMQDRIRKYISSQESIDILGLCSELVISQKQVKNDLPSHP